MSVDRTARVRQDDALLERVRELAPVIRSCRDAIDADRQLPDTLVEALRAAGMFRLFAPAKFGGPEIDPSTFVKIIEGLSAADGSIGWVVSVCSVGGLFAGYLSEESVAGIHGGNPDTIFAGSINPTGKAIAIDGGYKISGRWAFASGICHASWVYATCIVHDATGRPRLDENGKPEARVMLFPVTSCVIHDTWNVGALRGTGSHDFSTTDLFVPADHSLIAFATQASQPGILYQLPFSFFSVMLAAVPLGIARGAISALVDMAKTKRPTGAAVLLCEKPTAQIAIARAEALVRSARAFLFEALTQLTGEIAASGSASMQTRANLRLACTQTALNAVRAVDLMFETGGATSVYASCPIERCFRDVHAAMQHLALSETSLELAGRVLLGLDVGTSRF
jgi:alkylation response protein AidB-like acyl-CoA dehydrogenase